MKSPKQTNMALVLSHTDDFDEFFSDRFIETEFNDIYLNYERLNLQDGIEIPNTLCDILYSSLIPNGESGFTSFDVDWAQFRSTLLYDYVMKFKPDEQELKYKQKTNIADEIEIAMGKKEVPLKEFQKMNEFELLTDLFTESVKISWLVYLEYMPVEKYGLPAKNILEWLINNVFNIHNHKNIMIPEESYPYVIKTYDPYGLSKDIEIKYLKRLLAERGVDPDDQMAYDGFLDIKLQLEEGLRSDPQSIIASPPSVKLGTFRYFKEIADQVNEGLKNYLEDVSNKIPDTEYDNVKQRDPQPLPNLDYNIMCGNSLIDEFEGIKLFDDSILNKNTHDPTGATANWQTTLFSDSMDKSIEDLFKEQDRLFGEEDTNRKRTIKANIDKIIDDIIRAKLQKDGNADGHAKYEESLKQKTKPYFLWKLEFARVFKENDGFDIVIGNPPYVRVQTLSHEMIDKLKIRWSTAWKRIDISTLFMELAYSLMNSQGHMCYISSNQFLATEYGRMMRKYLIEHKSLVKIVDFGDLPIFQNALTYVSIFFVSKQAQTMFEYKKIDRLPFTLPANFDRILICNLTDDAWSLGAENRLSVIRKIKSTGNRLSKYAKCWAGVITGKDDLLMYDYEEDIPYIEDAMLTPIIRAQGCNRYVYAQPSKKIFYPYKEKNNNTELIELEELKKEYPLAYTFAVKNETELKARKDSRKTFGDKKGWYGLIRFGKLSRFRKPKIVSPGEVKDNKFSLDLTGSAFSCARVFSITVEDECVDIEYLLAILNSKLIEFFLHGVAPLKQGGYFSYSSSIIDAIPLIIENVSQQAFTTIVDQILSLKNADPNADTTSFEKQIDQMVYKLYGLTEEEIKIVEKS